MTDDPVRRGPQAVVRYAEKWQDIGCFQIAAVHLIEGNERGALDGWLVVVLQARSSRSRGINVDQGASQRLFQDAVLSAVTDSLQNHWDDGLVPEPAEAFGGRSCGLRSRVILRLPIAGQGSHERTA